MEDYGFNLDPNRKSLCDKMSLRERAEYFLEGFRDLDIFQSKGMIALWLFALSPIILLIAVIWKWLRS